MYCQLDLNLREKRLVSQPTPFIERGSGHTATIELLPQQKLDVTNQNRALCRSHPLSWSTITSRVYQMSASHYHYHNLTTVDLEIFVVKIFSWFA